MGQLLLTKALNTDPGVGQLLLSLIFLFCFVLIFGHRVSLAVLELALPNDRIKGVCLLPGS